VLDIDGYYQPLVELLDHAESSGFMQAADRALVTVVDSTSDVVATLRRAWTPI
jgi:predicted Rossmann-fold nucleotide-binding protein